MTAIPADPARYGPPPVLLTTLSSAALLDGRGDLELAREARGAPAEWGGVYGQLVRLTGPWRLSLVVDGDSRTLPETLVEAPGGTDRWRTRHRFGRLEVAETVVATEEPPGAVRRLRCSLTDGPALTLTLRSRFVPFLLPVLVEGIRPTSYRAIARPGELRVRQRGYALSFRSSVPPSRLYVNGAAWDGTSREGPVEEVASDHEVVLTPEGPVEVTFLISGGLERSVPDPASSELAIGDPIEAADRAERARVAWEARTPTLRFPEAPQLERAYALARSALRRLYSAPGDGLVGLVAGYPWYAAIWCRDLAWMLPAVLWLGDFDWAERSIDSVFRFQSRSELPLLGGEPGELPMQIAPGPLFLYGTSDTTLYYPELVLRLARHAGRASVPGPWRDALARIAGWGRARSDAETGLLRNGGEAETMEAAAGPVARIRYGIDAPDTTIWDSTDRRDHAIDVQVLWRGALRATAELLAGSPGPEEPAALTALAERVAASVTCRYAWPQEGYLYDSLRAGEPVAKLRPNALRAVSAGLLAPEAARSVVRRAARDDLTTPWGVRTLSSADPAFDPRAYHDGQVWPIATAWAADAALAAGERDLGFAYLTSIARQLAAEAPHANECFRGDREEPFDSCFVLGFSVAPFLTILFERLWGLAVDGREPCLAVRPAFPEALLRASIDGLRVGTGTARLRFDSGRLSVDWSGGAPLRLETAGGSAWVGPGESVEVDVFTGGAAPPPHP